MKLRAYQRADADIICSWITEEKCVYQWSANRIEKFPLSGDDLHRSYAPENNGRLIPLTAVDEEERVVGHLFIRYPNEKDDTTVRFGCVIVSPHLRGKGRGKELVGLAVDYAKTELKASRITLAVFTNNDGARYCYEAVGFRPTGKAVYPLAIGPWECVEMELTVG